MTKTAKIKKLIKNINKSKPEEEDIKVFSSIVIEVMAEWGISPQKRKEFFTESRKPSPDIGRLIRSAEKTVGLINEKAWSNN